MRVLADTESGELVEVLPEAVLGPQEPYDYADFRRSVMASSREHRQAIVDLQKADADAGRADANYRRALSLAMPKAKAEVGATMAEHRAKGYPEVADAYEERLAAEAISRAAQEKVRLCRDDRSALSAMGYWSREADADNWRDS